MDVQVGQVALAQRDEVAVGPQVGLHGDRLALAGDGELQVALGARPGVAVERDVVAVDVDLGGRGRDRPRLEVAGHEHVGGQRRLLAAVGAEVGVDAVDARRAEAQRHRPRSVALLDGMQVLVAGQVATYGDQVQALGVLDVEVADGGAAPVDDAEGVGLGLPERVDGGVGDQAQLAVGDGEAARGLRGAMTGAGHRRHAVGLAGRGALGPIGLDVRDAADRQRRAEDQHEHGGEAGEAGGDAHAATSTAVPRGPGAPPAYSAGRRGITPAMASSIARCSATINTPRSVTTPAHSTPMTAKVGTNIDADISALARRPWPRYIIHATIGTVIVVAMPRNMSAGASSLSADQLEPMALSAQPAGRPRMAIPENMAMTIST